MAPRAALLIACVALPVCGCLKAPATADRAGGCLSCHPPHYAGEGTCDECHRGNPTAERKDLAHASLLAGRVAEHRRAEAPAVRAGQHLVESLACRRCHSIGGRGNRHATDLDRIVWKREQAALVASITAPVENMPAFGLDSGQAETLTSFLLHVGQPDPPRETYRVQFEQTMSASPTAFERRCGGCHRFLGPAGPFGKGSQGPNLSGLFTEFYPRTAPGSRPWSEKLLDDWVRNPRAVRPGTTMLPPRLHEGEIRQVAAELRGE